MAEQTLRLPGSSYEELQKIIVAYSHINGKASNTDVSKRAALHPTVVSRNAGFLVECGILESGAQKQITSLGKNLAQALEHRLDDQIEVAWMDIFEQVPFFDTVMSAVRIRGGMDANTLRSHIAYTAGQKKNSVTMTGAQTVIDILKASGNLHENDGKLVVVPQDRRALQPEMTANLGRAPEIKVPHPSAISPTSPVVVQIQISVKPDDLDGLGAEIRNLLDEIAEKNSKTDD